LLNIEESPLFILATVASKSEIGVSVGAVAVSAIQTRSFVTNRPNRADDAR
jgi:hypothetical protein